MIVGIEFAFPARMGNCARLALLLLLAAACGEDLEEPTPFESRLPTESEDVDAAQRTDFIDFADIGSPVHGCNVDAGYSFEAKRFETSGSESIRVVGTYQAGHAGEFTLHVAEPGRFALVLTAHESVRWNISAGVNTEITRVIAMGYGHQQVVVDSPAVVTTMAHRDGERGLRGVSRWPDPARQCENEMPAAFCADFGGVWQQEIRRTHDVLNQLAKELDLPISGFYGCYDMDSLSLTR